jgi:hypothetical protein
LNHLSRFHRQSRPEAAGGRLVHPFSGREVTPAAPRAAQNRGQQRSRIIEARRTITTRCPRSQRASRHSCKRVGRGEQNRRGRVVPNRPPGSNTVVKNGDFPLAAQSRNTGLGKTGMRPILPRHSTLQPGLAANHPSR